MYLGVSPVKLVHLARSTHDDIGGDKHVLVPPHQIRKRHPCSPLVLILCQLSQLMSRCQNWGTEQPLDPVQSAGEWYGKCSCFPSPRLGLRRYPLGTVKNGSPLDGRRLLKTIGINPRGGILRVSYRQSCHSLIPVTPDHAFRRHPTRDGPRILTWSWVRLELWLDLTGKLRIKVT